MWVVKLGGSLSGSSYLGSWLRLFSENGGGRTAIVPGGGPYADEVRKAQINIGFDDQVAHEEALMAMEKYGQELCESQNQLVPARSLEEINDALTEKLVPVWMPSRLVVADKMIPASWDVTSDSLAAWIANRLNVEVLYLIKSATFNCRAISCDQLSGKGIVDKAFPKFVAKASYQIRLLSADQHDLMNEALTTRHIVGIRVIN